MNILSLFDGMSCGQIALNRVGVEITNYFASEIDKFAIEVTQANYPNTIQLGDITKVRAKDLPKIDILIGGSPCQGFSFAGKQLNFDDPRSKLFFEYVRLLEETKPLYFLLENVKMKKEYQDVISKYLGVEPIEINSALVSAQNRKRLYWTNIKGVGQPKDRGILLKSILNGEALTNKGQTILSTIYKENAKSMMKRNKKGLLVGVLKNKGLWIEKSNKSNCIDANYFKGVDNHGQRTMVVSPASIVGRRINERGVRDDYNKNVPLTQCLQVKHNSDKIGCLTTVQKDNVISKMPRGRYLENYEYRKLTPIECERLQTVPDNYTNHVSNTQRYKMLGNGWTVDAIAHIFKDFLIINLFEQILNLFEKNLCQNMRKSLSTNLKSL